MVILAAVGGRMSLVGAVYGALLVNFGKTYFSESFPDLWLFLMAAMFIGVVLAFPDGLAGVYHNRIKPWWLRQQAARRAGSRPADAAVATVPPKPAVPPGVAMPAEVAAMPPGLSGQQT